MNGSHFSHIPEEEKKKKWFLLIEPLARTRNSRLHPQDSRLLQTLNKQEGFRTWKDIKFAMEVALENVTNAERIFSRASHIKTEPDPDGVIDDMFAELRTIPYLLYKGFQNIQYNRRDALDFSCEFEGQSYEIEVAYVRGPTFKTQEQVFIEEPTLAPIFRLEARKLISRLQSVCDAKEKQALKYGRNALNTLIFVVSDLDEVYEPWLNHDEFQGNHPILGFVISRTIPTVIFSPGTVYEPPETSLDGAFGRLKVFDWTGFSKERVTQYSAERVADTTLEKSC